MVSNYTDAEAARILNHEAVTVRMTAEELEAARILADDERTSRNVNKVTDRALQMERKLSYELSYGKVNDR